MTEYFSEHLYERRNVCRNIWYEISYIIHYTQELPDLLCCEAGIWKFEQFLTYMWSWTVCTLVTCSSNISLNFPLVCLAFLLTQNASHAHCEFDGYIISNSKSSSRSLFARWRWLGYIPKWLDFVGLCHAPNHGLGVTCHSVPDCMWPSEPTVWLDQHVV